MAETGDWIPTKAHLLETRQVHIELHRKFNLEEISKEEFNTQLAETQDPSCLNCYPTPLKASQDFVVFYNELIKNKYIFATSSKTIELFGQYLKVTDKQTQYKCCAAILITLGFAPTFWKEDIEPSDL